MLLHRRTNASYLPVEARQSEVAGTPPSFECSRVYRIDPLIPHRTISCMLTWRLMYFGVAGRLQCRFISSSSLLLPFH